VDHFFVQVGLAFGHTHFLEYLSFKGSLNLLSLGAVRRPGIQSEDNIRTLTTSFQPQNLLAFIPKTGSFSGH
jgi:hypothetical protein